MSTSNCRLIPANLTLGVTLLVLAGCVASDAGSPAWLGTRDTINGVEVVRNPAAPLLGNDAAVVTVGWTASGAEMESAEAPLWEEPAEVRVAGGVVYVLDRLAARLYAHGSDDGTAHATIGRKGLGPGELRGPSDLAVRAGEVVVADGSSEIEVFDPSGAHLRSIHPNGIVFGLHALGPDRLLLSRFQGPDSPWLMVMGPTGESRSLHKPDWIVEQPAAMDDCSGVATTAATILRTHCTLLRFQVISDSGRVIREITVDRPAVHSTSAELAAYEQRMRQSLAEVGLPLAQAERMIADLRDRNRIKRLFQSIRHDAESGRYWIHEQMPEEFGGGPATLHRFDETGVYLTHLTFDRAWADYDAANGRVFALERDPDTDLVTLVAYTIDVPTRDYGMKEER